MTTSEPVEKSVIRTLILEEDLLKLRFLERALKSRGHEVTLCADSQAAWTEYARTPHPLVVLGGSVARALLLCRRLRELPEGGTSIVVVVGWGRRARESRAAMMVGADEYLALPMEPALAHVRLSAIERKVSALRDCERTEVALQEARSDLLQRIGRQSRRLETSNQALKLELSAREDTERALGAIRSELEGRIDKHLAQLQELEKALRAETARRSDVEATLVAFQRDEQKRRETDTLALQRVEESLAAERDRSRSLQEELEQATADAERAAARHEVERTAIRNLLEKEASLRNRLEADLLSARDAAKSQAERHAAEIERAREAFEAERARREETEGRSQEARVDADRQSAEQSKELNAAHEAREQETRRRERLEAQLSEAEAEAKRRQAEHQEELRSLHDTLEQEISRLEQIESSLRGAEDRAEQRTTSQEAEIARLRKSLAGESERRRRLEAGLERAEEEAERRATDHTNALRTVTEALQTEATDRAKGEAMMRAARDAAEARLEEANVELKRTQAELQSVQAELVAIRQDRTAAKAREDQADARLPTEALSSARSWLRVAVDEMIALTRLVLDSELTPQQREQLSHVRSAGATLLEALGTQLGPTNVTPLRRGPEPVRFDLEPALAAVLEPLANRARRKGLELQHHLLRHHAGPGGLRDDEIWGFVDGHPRQLQHALAKLVGNAIRFTDDGEVTICVDGVTARSTAIALLVTISDSGIGMSADRQLEIFEMLAKGRELLGSPSPTRALGLPIVARLVHQMGGRLWLESEPGQGSVFRFTARLDRPSEGSRTRAPISPAPERSDGTRSVLLADDTPADRITVSRALEERGYRVVTVDDGRTAVETFLGQPFDVALLDLQMPRMDGFEASAMIRTLEKPKRAGVPTLPILGLGGSSSSLEQMRREAVGIDRVVPKPVDPADLISAIEQLLTRAA